MTWLISLITGSRLGRWAAAGLLVAAALAVAVFRLIAIGAQRERARQTQASLDNLRNRVRTDDDLARLSADERRRRLARDWGVPDRRQ
jgi:hypothetical protein